MDRKLVGLIGAMGVLTTGEASQAAVAPPQSIEAAMQARSYADLLAPIPNAVALAAQRPQTPAAGPAEGPIEQVQVVILHHHHHHRYRRYRHYYRHHHHHHHHY